MKKILVSMLTLAMVLSLSACGADGAENSLVFSTGGVQGTYYGFGTVLAEVISDKTDTSLKAVASNGSRANVEALRDGKAQIAFVQSDVGDYAYRGVRLFEEGGKIDGFSTVCTLYLEQVQIITLDPAIKTVADLKGKNVSVGAAGSGVSFNAADVLNVYGLTEEDITPTYLSFSESVDVLKNGKIDAAFIVAGTPTSAVASLASSKELFVLSLDDEHIGALLKTSPYYSRNVIPKEVYGTSEDIRTVAIGAVLAARDDVPEQDVYNIISVIYENTESITKEYAKGAELDLSFAASYEAVPYHPGAAKYFAEKGITVKTK